MGGKNIEKEYNKRKLLYDSLKEEVEYILSTAIESSGIPIHDLSGRTKELDSLIKKANRKEIRDIFEIKDICGIRVICLFRSDINRIENIIEKKFNVIDKDDKLTTKPTEEFGYASVHCICKLQDTCSGPRYDDIKDIPFEIQIRTIAMHSWASISHYLDYKSTSAVPSHLRKDFIALSALFHLADSNFEMFFQSSKTSQEAESRKTLEQLEKSEEEINLDTLSAYLRKKYKDRKHAENIEISEVIKELRECNYQTITQLDIVLNKSYEAFLKFEKESPLASFSNFQDIGIVRISLKIYDDNYHSLLLKKHNVPEEAEMHNIAKYKKLIDFG